MTALRRGLPRRPGGEPWPPSDAPVAPELVEAEPVAAAAPEADAPGAAVSAAAPPARGGGETPALRRGLPRVAGGDPWPPADVLPAPAPTPPHAPTLPVPADVRPAAVSDAPAAAAVATPRAPAVPTADGPRLAVRRGLPRSPGGDGWPPADFVAFAPVAEPSAAVDDAPRAAAATPAEPATRVTERPATLARPATAWAGRAVHARAESQERPWHRPHWPRALTGALVAVGLVVVAASAVFLVRWALSLEGGQAFLERFPGEYHLPEGTAPGFPAWARWGHFFNMFLMILIIRTGLQVRRQKKPPAFWSPRWNPSRKISITLWLHQSLDILWMVNGVVFVVLLFATGHWARIVPTSWEVFPNALSAALQYVSLDWPVENGWVNYNSLQQLAYFTTVFLAAPLAALSGFRMSGLWPTKATTLSRVYPIELARAVHFPVMLYFVVFIVFHVALVFATGALRNLNHMYAGQDVVNWTGFWILLGSVVVTGAAWLAARPIILAPIASLTGSVSNR